MPLLPLTFVAIVAMASPFEDRLATKLKGNEGSPCLASPLTIGDKAITFYNTDFDSPRWQANSHT